MKHCNDWKKQFNSIQFIKTAFGFWITLPKKHFTEIFYLKGHLTETPLDRTPFDRMPIDWKFIRPNRRLSERRLTESSFYRKVIWPIFFSEVVIWPTIFREKLSVIWTFGQMTFRSNNLSVK
jgi:hypothetical protein